MNPVVTRRANPRPRTPVTLLLSMTFVATNVVCPYATETNIWTERREGLQMRRQWQVQQEAAELPPLPPTTRLDPLEPAPALPAGQPATEALSRLSPFILPHALVSQVRFAAVPQAPLVIHIQDIHGVAEAQRNIGGLIRSLGEAGVTLVGMEGAEGSFSVDALRGAARPEIVRDVAEYFFREGRLTGAEHAALTADRPPLLWGVEDMAVYRANVAAVRRGAARHGEARAWTDALAGRTAALKTRIYSPALHEFDRRVEAHAGGRETLGDFVGYLMDPAKGDTRGSPQLRRLLSALEAERTLDFGAAERERALLARRLARSLPPADVEDLVRRNLQHRAGRWSFGQYHRHVLDLCRRHGVSLTDLPHVRAYIDYVLLSEGIDRAALLDELEKRTRAVQDALADTPDRRRLAAADRRLALARRLVEHQMTPSDWAAYEEDRAAVRSLPDELRALAIEGSLDPGPAAPPADILEPFDSFCRLALARNEHFARNLLSKMAAEKTGVAVLVAGGFHTADLTARLAAAGASTLVVTPKLTDVPADDRYLDVFTRDPLPLEKMFRGEVISLLDEPKTSLGADPSLRTQAALAAAALEALESTPEEARDLLARSLPPGLAPRVEETSGAAVASADFPNRVRAVAAAAAAAPVAARAAPWHRSQEPVAIHGQSVAFGQVVPPAALARRWVSEAEDLIERTPPLLLMLAFLPFILGFSGAPGGGRTPFDDVFDVVHRAAAGLALRPEAAASVAVGALLLAGLGSWLALRALRNALRRRGPPPAPRLTEETLEKIHAAGLIAPVTTGPLLAEGGTAEVFLGFFDRREVVIKKPKAGHEDLLAQEADMHWLFKERSTGNPDAFRDIPEPLLRGPRGLQVMSFLAGDELRAWLKGGGERCGKKPSSLEVLKMFGTFLEVLRTFHAARMVHGDIAVRNLLVRDGRARLADFTTARPFGQRTSFPDGRLVGTITTAPPETYDGVADYAAGRSPAYGPEAAPSLDIYMAGAVLVQMLSGRSRPEGFDRIGPVLVSAGAVARGWLTEVNRLPYSDEMKAFLRRCLALRPEDRFPDTDAMLAAFQALPELRNTGSGVRPVAPRHPVDKLLEAAAEVTGVISEEELFRLRALLWEARDKPWPGVEIPGPAPDTAPAAIHTPPPAPVPSESGEHPRAPPSDGVAPPWQAQPTSWRGTRLVLEFTDAFHSDLVRSPAAADRRRLLRAFFLKKKPVDLEKLPRGYAIFPKLRGHTLFLSTVDGEDGRLAVRLLGFKSEAETGADDGALRAASRAARKDQRLLKEAEGDLDKVAEIKGHLHLGPAPLPSFLRKLGPLITLLFTLGVSAWAAPAGAALKGAIPDGMEQPAAPAGVAERVLDETFPAAFLNGPARPVLFEVRVGAVRAGPDLRATVSAPSARADEDSDLGALLDAAGASDKALAAAYARLRSDPRARTAAARRAMAELNQDGAWLWAALLHAAGHSLFTALRPGERPEGNLSPQAWDLALLVRESAARGADASALAERARLLYEGPRRKAALLRSIDESVQEARGDAKRLLVFDVSALFDPAADPAAQRDLRDTLRALNDDPTGLAGRVTLANNRGTRAQLESLSRTLPALAPLLEHRPGGPIPLGALARQGFRIHAFVLSADNVDQTGLPEGSVVEVLLGLALVRNATQTILRGISSLRFIHISA